MFGNKFMTVIIILSLVFTLGLSDLLLFYFSGNDATISRVLLGKEASMPALAVNVSYTFGLLLAHFFMFTERSEPTWTGLFIRIFSALSPTIVGLIMISSLKDAGDSQIVKVLNHPIITSFLISFGLFTGMLMGYWLVPQHISK